MIHLIVGNTGSGKTTYSEKLKAETKGIIFSIDKWNNTLFFPDMTNNEGLDWILERIERSEKIIFDLIIQLENAGIDSILDLGFSKYEHREKFRSFANQSGFLHKIHYLEISSDIRFERVMERNRTQGASFEFEVSKENFDFMEDWFEIPNEDELKDGIVIKE